jgi:hypothetical protein
MTILTFTLLIFGTSVTAGLLGALTGLGGGVVVVPVLALLFHVDLRYAIGASLVSVIATSSGAAAAYVREGFSNIRIGMFLEIATTIGAVAGALVGSHIPTAYLSIIFGLILLQSAAQAVHDKKNNARPHAADSIAQKLKLDGSYTTPQGVERYEVHHVKSGFALMFGAGAISGLLGIGSGSLKVIAMDQVLKIPFKVSTATSNFMIGVTAAASASLYLSRGYVDPAVTMPVLLGVLAGSTIGARFLPILPVTVLRRVFAVVVGVMAIQMIWGGWLHR